MKQILESRSVVIIGIAESVSGLGNWITTMAIVALVIFQGGGSTAQSSGIFLAFFIPMLVVSPLAGQLADRFDRKKLMIASELLSAGAIIGLIFARQLWLIYGLLALQSVFGAVMHPARLAALPSLVDRDDLTRVNAFLQQLAAVIKVMGPMLAGLLLAVISPQMTMVLDVVSFILSALILTRLPALLPEAASDRVDEEVAPPSEKLLDVLRRVPLLVLLFVAMFFGIMIIMSLDILFSIYVRDILLAGESMLGLMVGLIGLGSVGATTLLLARKGEATVWQAWRDVILAMVLLSQLPIAFAAATYLNDVSLRRWVVLAATLIGGVGNGLVLVQVGTLMQLLSPENLLGRIGGIYQAVAVSGQLLTTLALPLLVPGLLPIGTFFIIASGLYLLLIMITVIILFKKRQDTEHSVQIATT